jgi:hypothetical protein
LKEQAGVAALMNPALSSSAVTLPGFIIRRRFSGLADWVPILNGPRFAARKHIITVTNKVITDGDGCGGLGPKFRLARQASVEGILFIVC